MSLLYCASILNAGSPGVTPSWSAPVFLDVGANCHYHIAADLNNDGRPDLIVATRSTDRLHVFINQGAGVFAPDMTVPTIDDPLSVAALDIDGDQDLDLLVVGHVSQSLQAHINNGAGSFSLGWSASLGGRGHGIDVADFDGDGLVDVAVTVVEGGEHVRIFWNSGGGSLAPGPALITGSPYYVTAGDLDGDGDADIVVCNRGFDAISVYRNDRSLGFVALAPFSAQGVLPGRIEVADVDGNGRADLLVPHTGSAWLTRFEAIGGGAFAFVETIQGTWSSGPMGYWVDSADLNLDGRLDLVVGPAPIDGLGVALQGSSGPWGEVLALPAGSNINAVHLVDLDGDGLPDITASAHDSHAIVLLFNTTPVDCNLNGTPDVQDITNGSSPDCDGNGVPDECDLAAGPEVDCDADGQLDACEIAANPSLDGDIDGTLDVCENPGTSFCSGDGSIPTLCPCTPPNTVPNPSAAPGHGCANSFDLGGALLSVTGTPQPDSVRFTCAIGPNYSAFGFIVKGNASSPNGVQLADGIMCISGALVRFGGHKAGSNGDALGSWTYPNTAQTTSVSASTGQASAERAYYQLYYRNAAANFCSPGTANLSNGIDIAWP